MTHKNDQLQSELDRLKKMCGYYEEIIENNPDGIYITDGNANAILINKAFERISGLRREDLLGKNHRELERLGIIAKSCALEAIEKKKTVTIVHEYLTTNRQALDTCTPLLDEAGKVVLTVSSIRDMTDLNHLQSRYEEEFELRIKYEKQLEVVSERINRSKQLIVQDENMLKTLTLANRMSRVDSRVLLIGETGVGKEEIAQYIHRYSDRNKKPFIGINCGAIPENLIESELFGYVSGAFTGAHKDGKTGILEAADKGTLFLDEVGELPLNVQVKLLRVLQTNKVTRIGGRTDIPVDVRIISATNRDLKEMVKVGTFREDLYYRLGVVPIQVPPLRERPGDIVPLVNFFLEQLNHQYGLNKRFSKAAYDIMLSYQWPGNVRELKNVVERTVVTSEADMMTAEDLPIYQYNPVQVLTRREGRSLKEQVELLEYSLIMEAYEKHQNVRSAAESLGMSEPTYVRKRKFYMNKFVK